MGKYDRLVFVDVEAAGRSPISGVLTEFGAVHYTSREAFHGKMWIAVPDPSNPAVPIPDRRVNTDFDTMRLFALWLDSVVDGRPVFVSDNPAYDFQWVNAWFDKANMDNPFGHSGRRISDFWAGLERKWSDTQSWKRFRVTPHDHNPVNDAMGNVEAFEHLLSLHSLAVK